MPNCVKSNAYDYLKLLMKYFKKNGYAIGFGINVKQPLIMLLKADHLSMNWLQLLLDCHLKCKVTIDEQTYYSAIKLCETKHELRQYKAVIEENYQKLHRASLQWR